MNAPAWPQTPGTFLSLWRGEVQRIQTATPRDETYCVIDRIATEYGLGRAVLLSRCRTPRVTEARQAAMCALRAERRLSLPQIGRVLNRDHSTVLHGIRAHQKRMEAAQVDQA